MSREIVRNSLTVVWCAAVVSLCPATARAQQRGGQAHDAISTGSLSAPLFFDGILSWGDTAPPIGSRPTPSTKARDPRDATLLVDGDEWTAPDGAGPIQIELAEGTHEVEVRKQGLSTFHRTVRVRVGETTSLNVSLLR